jgi:hypothetical protein
VQPVALPRVLTADVAVRVGITRGRVRSEIRRGNWQRVAGGLVLTRPDEPTREDWADVGVALAGPGSAVTGWDALRARGLGDRRPPSNLVVVLSPGAMNRVVGAVRIRRTSRPFRRQVQPLGSPYELTPVVEVARAVTDAALEYGELNAVRALVSVSLQRRRCTIDELVAEYRAGPRNRSGALREALSDALDGARSAAEGMAARRLARGRVPPFELNVPVVDERGHLLYVIDELWRELRAGVEIDSREHHFDEADWERTMVRHNFLTRCGLALMHYAPGLVTRRDSTFVSDVGLWLRERAAELGVPVPRGHGVRRPVVGTDPAPLVVHTGSP